MLTDITLSSEIKQLDKKHCSNNAFFNHLRVFLKKNNTTEDRKKLFKSLNKRYLNTYTKMIKVRKKLLKQVNPKIDRPKTDRDKYLRRTYNITEKDYDNMIKAQSGLCLICENHKNGKHKYFAVDHCHISGKVRGLLCNTCNAGIGMLKDSIPNLKRAMKYLFDNLPK